MRSNAPAPETSAATFIEDAKAKLAGYRAHISEMDLVATQFDFNDHALCAPTNS